MGLLGYHTLPRYHYVRLELETDEKNKLAYKKNINNIIILF